MRTSALTLTALAASTLSIAAPPKATLVLRPQGLPDHDGRPPVVTAVAVSPDGSVVAAAGDDHRVRVWRTDSLDAPQTLDAHEDWVHAVRFAPDGDRLASVGADHTICLWTLSRPSTPLASRRVCGGALQAVAWRPDGLALVTAGFGDRLRLFDLTGDTAAPDERPCACEDTRSVVYSPNGRWIAAAGRNGVVRLWDTVGSGGPRDLPSDGRRVRALAFSPDGETLAAGGDGPAVRLWRVEEDGIDPAPRELLVRPGKIHALAFTDETTLATGGTRNEVRLWDTESMSPGDTLRGHTGTVAALAVSADGGRLVSGSFDTTVRVWDLAVRTASRATGEKR